MSSFIILYHKNAEEETVTELEKKVKENVEREKETRSKTSMLWLRGAFKNKTRL